MVKISIVIPVYNTEEYLPKCLDSVVNQTLRDIEIIIVDDCSKGNCEEIVKAYQEKDKRIVYIKHDFNLGLFIARKTGVKKANGDYIIHLDSDDTLSLDTCEESLKTIQKYTPDMIQISLYRMNRGQSSSTHLCMDYKKGKEVFQTLFVEQTYISWGIGGKIIKKELLLKAYLEIPENIYLINAEDCLLNFICAYFAQSFVGCPKGRYFYYIRDNSSSHKMFSTEEEQQKWFANFQCFYSLWDAFKEKYHIGAQYPVIANEIYNDYWTIDAFFQKFPQRDLKVYFSQLCSIMKLERVFNILLAYYPLSQVLDLIPSYKSKKYRPVKSIALIGENLHGGGTNRMVSLLANELISLGYQVTVITEQDITDNDFFLPKEVFRGVLGKDNRYTKLSDLLHKYNIDTVITQDYWRAETCYDLFYFRMRGDINIINSLHNTPIWSYYSSLLKEYFEEYILKSFYKCADVMTVLSQRDKIYLEQQEKIPIVYMPNLLTFDKELKQLNNLDSLNIIYIGRFTKEKNVLFLLKAFYIVQKNIPNAKLFLIGDGEERYAIEELIAYLGLEQSVLLTGYINNIQEYLQNSSIHVLPSIFEGQGMVWTEAKAYGIPSVVSRMEYNELAYYEGAILVDHEDITTFSDALILLLKDKKYRQKLGKEAKESLKYFANKDTAQRWQEFFKSMSENNLKESSVLVNNELDKEEVLAIYDREIMRSFRIQSSIREFYETGSFSVNRKIRRFIKWSIKKVTNFIIPKGSKNRYKIKKVIELFKKIGS